MGHKIPFSHIDFLTKGPSATKTTQVATLQNYIQELLGDTHHTFLQGSYVNDTAIADINDVDIVAVRKTTYSSIHSPHKFDSSIPWESIFLEIEMKLRSQSRYVWTVTRGDKCIKIRGAFDVDVVPAVKVDHDHTTDPVVIYSMESLNEKPNFPRTFYDNGVTKNKATDGLYKPVVRMFKNWARNHINDDKIVSSFKIQALVYNSSNENFYTDMVRTFILIANEINTLLKQRDALPIKIMSVCGSEDISENWDRDRRNIFRQKLEKSVDIALQAHKATSEFEAVRLWRSAFNL